VGRLQLALGSFDDEQEWTTVTDQKANPKGDHHEDV
jgi:hypothetical protein